MVEPKGMVFKNEHETNGEKWYSYNFSVSAKKIDGEGYDSASMPIRFWKGIEAPDNKTRIKITDGWLKPYKFKNVSVVGWFVKEYEVIGNEEPSGYMALVDDDIPF